MLTARQVAGMAGPEDKGCDCPACGWMSGLKKLICEPVTAYEEAVRKACGDDTFIAWPCVVVIAVGRMRAQGASLHDIGFAVSHGMGTAEEQNPLLCQGVTGPAQ